MKIVVDEMPQKSSDCPFYCVKFGSCDLPGDSCRCRLNGDEGCPHLVGHSKVNNIIMNGDMIGRIDIR